MSGSVLDAAIAVLRRLTQPLIVAIYVAFTVVVVAQVFFRFVLNDSLVWAEEFVRYSMLWSVLLGASLVSARREHINVDFLREQLSPAGRQRLDKLNACLVVIFCGCLVWFGIRFAQRASLAISPAAGYPMYIVYAAMPIGGALIAFFTLASLRRNTNGREAESADPEGL
jgi:TRAP-type C4-dicarboxylate transport system permease small subunit